MRREIPQPEVREAIIQTEGELAVAAARLGLARWQLVRWYIEESPSLQSLLVDIKEGRDDEAESELADAVYAGRLDAACFCLRTIGRRRGYGKPMTPEEEALVPNPGPMPSSHEAESLTEQQEAAFRRIAAKACPGSPARPAYFDRLDANRDELKAVIGENRGNLSRTARHFDLTRPELVDYIQGDVDYLALIVDAREALLDRAEAVLNAQRGHNLSAAKFRLEYSSQGRGYSKHPKPMKSFWKNMTAEYESFDMRRLDPEDIRQLRQIGAEVGLAGVALGLPISPDEVGKSSERSAPSPTPTPALTVSPDEVGKSSERSAPSTTPTPALTVSPDEVGKSSERSEPSPTPTPDLTVSPDEVGKSSERSALSPLFPAGMEKQTKRKMRDEMEERAKTPGPEMEKILMRFKSPIEARMIVECWNDLEEPARRVLQYQIWNHIEREYHPFTPIKKLSEPRPPP